MISAVHGVSKFCCERLEESLLPVRGDLVKKISCYALHVFECLLFLPLAIATSTISFAASRLFPAKNNDSSLIAFAKHPTWGDKPVEAAPVEIGFATADFQDNGAKQHPNTNWGQHHQKHFPNIDHVPDIWNHPERVIERLTELGVKKFRFSVSRDQIELKPGEFNEVAIEHYRAFTLQLIEAGIEPMATLDHFTEPLYFSWDRAKDVDGFVAFAEKISETLYDAGVRKIVTLNEPTVVAFQGWVMGEFPPHGKIDFETAAKALENMMLAHCRVYKALKNKHAEFEIGLSHDPIRFRSFHKLNPLFAPAEKLVCHYLTEINHSALMRYLQTGKFSLKVPFCTDYSFETEKPPLDFIGLQYYTDPLLKFSFTGGDSVTRKEGEKITSYQYRQYPQGLASALEEFRSLGIPIDLTEIGIDTGINLDENDLERIAHFDKIFQVVQKAIDDNVQVRSLYFWTLIDNLEWYKAWTVRFGFYRFDEQTGEIAKRPAADWLKEKIAARNQVPMAI